MKNVKLAILFILSILLITGLMSCASGGEEKSAEVSDEASDEVSSITEQSSETEKNEKSQPESKEVKHSVNVYNIKDYGAKGNGSDDSAYIQAAIDICAAAGGGTVYLPTGVYTVGKTIYKKANVSIVGDGMWSTRLVWNGASDSAVINTANEALWGTSIENLFITTSGVEKVTGILGGSTLQKYNSAIGTFKNLVFSGLYCGIDGSAEPEGVGIFDCLFENIFCSSCTNGLHLYGSGNTIIHPRIATCEAGLVLDYLNGESFDGVHVIGGIFASNVTDILIPSKGGTRPCDFVGTWFENASRGILNITNPATRIMNLTFRDCMLNSSADNNNYFLFDASNAMGVVTLDSCTVVTYAGIKAPTDKSSVLAMTNLQVYDGSGSYIISDRDNGNYSKTVNGDKTAYRIAHSLEAVPTTVNLTPTTPVSAASEYYVTVDENYITVNFVTAPVGEIGFYWEAIR